MPPAPALCTGAPTGDFPLGCTIGFQMLGCARARSWPARDSCWSDAWQPLCSCACWISLRRCRAVGAGPDQDQEYHGPSAQSGQQLQLASGRGTQISSSKSRSTKAGISIIGTISKSCSQWVSETRCMSCARTCSRTSSSSMSRATMPLRSGT